MPHVAFLLYPGFTALDAVGPCEVLARIPGAKISFVAKEQGPVRTDMGAVVIHANATLEKVSTPDVVLVPGLLGTVAAAKDERLIDWVATAHESSQWTTSVCTGALLLGAAGLLNGHTATTHWAARGRLAKYGATYVPERYVRHGKVITAAGVSAGIDMALALAATLTSTDEAKALQLLIEYDPEPPFSTGSREKAQPETVNRAGRLLRNAVARDVGRRTWSRLSPSVRTRAQDSNLGVP